MLIEIRGTGTHNKGAELMLCAIVQYFRRRCRDVRFAVEPRFGPYDARAKYGLLTKVRGSRYGRSRIAVAMMSRAFRASYGLASEADVDVVLDASGFAFGDQWGPGPSERLLAESARWRRRGTVGVLLPQAFGPFDNEHVRRAFQQALHSVPLVFARDTRSYEYIQGLGGRLAHVKEAPDFTNIVEGECPVGLSLPARFGCVVPNVRMLDRTAASERDSYVRFLTRAIRELERHDITPVLVCHGGQQDRQVGQLVEREMERPLTWIEESDPVRLKGITGRAVVLVGSRFHALVGALSQGVPAVGTSWSHKYEALFDDYQCGEFLLSPSANGGEVESLLSRVCNSPTIDGFREQLRQRAARLRERVDRMFDDVSRVVGL